MRRAQKTDRIWGRCMDVAHLLLLAVVLGLALWGMRVIASATAPSAPARQTPRAVYIVPGP